MAEHAAAVTDAIATATAEKEKGLPEKSFEKHRGVW
jgi:hypothetical protein